MKFHRTLFVGLALLFFLNPIVRAENCAYHLKVKTAVSESLDKVPWFLERWSFKAFSYVLRKNIEKKCPLETCNDVALQRITDETVRKWTSLMRVGRGWITWIALVGGIIGGGMYFTDTPLPDSKNIVLGAGAALVFGLSRPLKDPIENLYRIINYSIIGYSSYTTEHSPVLSPYPRFARIYQGERSMGHNELWGRNSLYQAKVMLENALRDARNQLLETGYPERFKLKAAATLIASVAKDIKILFPTFSAYDDYLRGIFHFVFLEQVVPGAVDFGELKQETINVLKEKVDKEYGSDNLVRMHYDAVLDGWFEVVVPSSLEPVVVAAP
ncbi:MAG: hypothetical protein AB7F43_00495 [Bacteriovoracia bacterium]